MANVAKKGKKNNSNKGKTEKIEKMKLIDKLKEKVKNNKDSLIIYGSVSIIMIVCFIIFYGAYILKPTYTDWLLGYGQDLSQHYLGWRAFRMSKWSFPIIGYTNMLAYPSNTSVYYTDSNPGLAIFFKILSPLLPSKFQYTGFFGLLCIVLNGLMAARILSKFTEDKINVIIGSSIFGVVPVLIFRMFYHIDLCAQFLITLALESIILYKKVYKNDSKKLYKLWFVISVLTIFIHFYFVLIDGIILVGLCIYDILETKKVKRSLYLLLIYILTAMLIFFIIGGFQSGYAPTGVGLGYFSANLNALFNPQGYSFILKDLPYGGGQYEGFGYLGLGCISLAIISLFLIFKNHGDIKKDKNMVISLIVTFLIAYLFAMSPKGTYGTKVLWDIDLPDFIENAWAIFRSTGRVVWIPVYMIMIVSTVAICKYGKNKNFVTLIFVFGLLFQFVDMQNVVKQFNNYYNRQIVYNDGLSNSDFWNALGNDIKYNHIVFTYGESINKIYPIANFAFDHELSINMFYFARDFSDTLSDNLNKIMEHPSDKNIYIFSSKNKSYCKNMNLNCYSIDGYEIGTAYEVDYLK